MKRMSLAAIGAALVSAAGLGTAGTGRTAPAACPDGYQLTPVSFLPEKYADRDKNGNFLLCAKTPPSSNDHANGKDDKLVIDDIV